MGFLDFLTQTIAIDPGSHTLRIVKDGALIFNEPSKILISAADNSVIEIGNAVSNAPPDKILEPVDYVISDFSGFERLLRAAITKSITSKSIFPRSYKMFFGVPTNASEAEKRVYRDSGEHAAATEIYLIPQSYCSAVAMGILFEKKDFILIDISASKTEITIFSNSFIVSTGMVRIGTAKIFQMIRNHIRRSHNFILTNPEILEIFGTLEKNGDSSPIQIHHNTIQAGEIQKILDHMFYLINDEIFQTCERVSNHPAMVKILGGGLHFTGGGSMIRHLRNQIQLNDKLPVLLSQTPLLDIINGLRIIMADVSTYRNYIYC